MPSYTVIKPGFFNGKYYSPEGKRRILHSSKPFPKKKIPSWLKEMPKESAAVKAKREAQEKSQRVADLEKAEQDHNDISTAASEGDGAETSFLDSVGETPAGSSVETL